MTRAPAHVRLPLQVGTTAFAALARCAALLLPSFALLCVAVPMVVGVAVVGAAIVLDVGSGLKALGIVLAICAAVLLGLWALLRSAVRHLRLAVRERPSDVVFEAEAVRVIGGPHHDGVYPFHASAAALERETKERTYLWSFKKMEPFATEKLEVVKLRLGGDVVAQAVHPVEQESLGALHETLRARAEPDQASAGGDPALLRCPQCAAPAAPEDSETVACASCGARVPVPAAVRKRIRAHRRVEAIRPANERQVARLLAQPSARAVGGVMVALGLPILLVWPAVAVLGGVLIYRGQLEAGNAFLLVGCALVALVSLFFLMRASLVSRQALALVTARFSARAPVAAGEPHRCRECAAPLAAEDRVLVGCAYCGAVNVLGLDLRREAGRETKQARTLDAELARRRRARFVWGALALAAVGGLAGERWLVPAAIAPRSDRARCRAADVAACLRDARAREARDSGDYGGDDVEGAYDELQRACRLGSPEGCREAARVAYTWKRYEGKEVPALEKGCEAGDGLACNGAGWILQETEPARAAALYRRACDVGTMKGCNNLGFLHARGRGVDEDHTRALALYEQACEGGNAMGCANAGWEHEHGATPDLARALARYEQACAQQSERCVDAADYHVRRCDAGDPAGCRRAVDLFLPRKDEPTKNERHVYQVACDAGYVPGCNGAGLAAAKDRNPKAARALYAKACDGGWGDACNNLGVLLVKGLGGPTDLPRALELYDKACGLKAEFACDNAVAIRRRLASEQ